MFQVIFYIKMIPLVIVKGVIIMKFMLIAMWICILYMWTSEFKNSDNALYIQTVIYWNILLALK